MNCRICQSPDVGSIGGQVPACDQHWAGQAIRWFRHLARISQLELSTRAGISTRSISEYERGTQIPTATALIRVARGLDLEPGLLLPPYRAT